MIFSLGDAPLVGSASAIEAQNSVARIVAFIVNI